MNLAQATPDAPQKIPPNMTIASAGLCCSLGYHLDAAVCALRANMDHFQESEFISQTSDPIRVASLPDQLFGEERLQRWVEYAVRDCAQRMTDARSLFDVTRTAVIVLGSDHSRPHADGQTVANIVWRAMTQLCSDVADNTPYSTKPGILVVSQGRAGLGQALLNAAQLLVKGQAEQVLLIGVDSYLNAADINTYLQAERLFVSGNTDGFLPGEAAAALLLRIAPTGAAGLSIKGVGLANEPGQPDGSVPSLAQGLTQAIRTACEQANIAPTDLDFRISDQNGEQFFAKEAANAITRVMFGGHKLTHLTLADKIGEVGAASGPAMLAWLTRDMADANYSPGNSGLIHLASDHGARCAVVIAHQGES